MNLSVSHKYYSRHILCCADTEYIQLHLTSLSLSARCGPTPPVYSEVHLQVVILPFKEPVPLTSPVKAVTSSSPTSPHSRGSQRWWSHLHKTAQSIYRRWENPRCSVLRRLRNIVGNCADHFCCGSSRLKQGLCAFASSQISRQHKTSVATRCTKW